MTPFSLSLPRRLGLSLVCVAASWLPAGASAEVDDADDGASLAALEQQFWDCDFLSTQLALSPQDGAQCVALHDELKRRRFGDRFELLLAWWQTHKAAQHALRADRNARGEVDDSLTPSPTQWPMP